MQSQTPEPHRRMVGQGYGLDDPPAAVGIIADLADVPCHTKECRLHLCGGHGRVFRQNLSADAADIGTGVRCSAFPLSLCRIAVGDGRQIDARCQNIDIAALRELRTLPSVRRSDPNHPVIHGGIIDTVGVGSYAAPFMLLFIIIKSSNFHYLLHPYHNNLSHQGV